MIGQCFNANLNMETLVLDPLSKLGGEELKALPFGGLELMTAYGAAVESLNEDSTVIDLIPPDFYRRSDRRAFNKRMITTTVFTLIAIVASGVALFDFRNERHRLAGDYQDKIAGMEPYAVVLEKGIKNFRFLCALWSDQRQALSVVIGCFAAQGKDVKKAFRNIHNKPKCQAP